ncbi:hypothetical protein C1645_769827 [Glomus cerebriforme]|uniref:Uncharacterized protein n=1 Tax=Glomus cerebriforme TaxID=658196 RepID=A0A397SWX2_9GLOM|nr:hypothetical protein C1645_769827 [Glomus cerebriforme]
MKQALLIDLKSQDIEENKAVTQIVLKKELEGTQTDLQVLKKGLDETKTDLQVLMRELKEIKQVLLKDEK